MSLKKFIPIVLVLIMVFTCFCACNTNQTGTDDEAASGTTQNTPATPIDIKTDGGVVLVGKICFDKDEWYFETEQPLNITFEYILDNPSVFTEQTKIKMFAPEVDGIEKSLYLGQTVTAEGTFSFYRDDFETLYFLPYTTTLGKIVESCYSAPGFQPPEEPENLYDPSMIAAESLQF